MRDAANLLGVHANTVRSWTDQGRLGCLRINRRGDRRYLRAEIERFLADAGEPSLRRDADPHDGDGDGDGVSSLVARTGELAAEAADLPTLLSEVCGLLCTTGGYRAATIIYEEGTTVRLIGRLIGDRRLWQRARHAGSPQIGRPRGAAGRYRVALPIRAGQRRISVLMLEGGHDTRTTDEPHVLAAIAYQLEMWMRLAERVAAVVEADRRAQLLMSIGTEMGAQLDPRQVFSQLVDRAVKLFGADHAAVFSPAPDGSFRTEVTHNLSIEYCQFVERASSRPLISRAFKEGHVVSATDYADDPRAIELRPALLREGINTVTVAPLLSDGQPLGALALHHDRPYHWSESDLALLERLAHHGATVMRSAQNYIQMATWAAQLHSIQQLGARLTRLRTVKEIGQAICSELTQLIDSHNIRVYRVEDDECLPVAWRGEVGEYEEEDGEQLRLKVGEGITGWVARYGLAQNLGDAAGDRRAKTIPGTNADLDESLLLAPMLYEDEVIGVIVLAKLGLDQFGADDLRLLEIYASIAAQAMANADATERLHAQSETLARQVHSQRELLRVTESILSTLDTQALLEEIADSLKTLVEVDNICVDVHDQAARMLRPIFARGAHAAEYLAASLPDDQGAGGHVIRTGEPLLIQDELKDPRVAHFDATGPLAGAMIVAPLRSGEGVQGLLTIERLGEKAHFSQDEFELVKLFAAHVSIALRNAATHRAVELRAETDRLTELWNHGALIERIDRLVGERSRFAVLMVDLDFFKRYNDHFGHQAGNVMLQRVAGLLRASGRDSDQVFRFGGDEFALLLPNTGLAGARTVAERVHAAVAEVNDGRTAAAPLSCSVGVAVYPKDGHDGASIILAADRACYAGKRAGRDRIATAAEGLALAEDFRPTEPTPLEPSAPAYSAA